VVGVLPNHLEQAEKTGIDFVKTVYPEVKVFLPQ